MHKRRETLLLFQNWGVITAQKSSHCQQKNFSQPRWGLGWTSHCDCRFRLFTRSTIPVAFFSHSESATGVVFNPKGQGSLMQQQPFRLWEETGDVPDCGMPVKGSKGLTKAWGFSKELFWSLLFNSSLEQVWLLLASIQPLLAWESVSTAPNFCRALVCTKWSWHWPSSLFECLFLFR